MDESRESGFLSAKLDEAWIRRLKEANSWNTKLAKGEIRPGLVKRVSWAIQALHAGVNYSDRRVFLEKRWREVDGRKEPSLAWALNDTFGHLFWIGGGYKVGFLLFHWR
jgi:ATP-binding cassette subfamily C (CFTR/MRP) protein 1